MKTILFNNTPELSKKYFDEFLSPKIGDDSFIFQASRWPILHVTYDGEQIISVGCSRDKQSFFNSHSIGNLIDETI